MASNKKNVPKSINLELTAMCIAARKAGMSYGIFVSHLTAEERLRIIQEYKDSLDTGRKDNSDEDQSMDDSHG